MDDKTVLLFPHTQLRERELDTVLARFPRLAVCLPWTMDRIFPASVDPPGPSVTIFRPPETHRPDENFHAILRSYTDWMMQHRHGDFPGFVKSLQDGYGREDARWEIGRMIRQGEAGPDTRRDDALKWHLVLHLARQTEEAADEADVMLSQLKDLKSPLEDAVDGNAAAGTLFDDLTPFHAGPLSDSKRVRGIVEAWIGLFGDHLAHCDLLLTFSPVVVDHVTRLFGETRQPEDTGGNDGTEPAAPVVRYAFPAFTENAALGSREPARRLAGKTLLLMQP